MSSVYGLTIIHDLPIELLVHVFLDVSSYDVTNIAENPEKLSHAPPVVLSHVCSRWRAIALDTPRLWTLVVLSQAACRSGLLPAFSQRRGEGSPVDLIYCPNPVHTTVFGEMVVMHSLLSDVSYRRIRTLIARYAWGANFPPQIPARHNHLRYMARWPTRRSRSSHRGVAGSSPWEKPCRPMILRLWVPFPMTRQTRAWKVTLPRRTSMQSKPSA
ncbi:hypothetical protein EV121DRAFT_284149 [Schizophyllum commune]